MWLFQGTLAVLALLPGLAQSGGISIKTLGEAMGYVENELPDLFSKTLRRSWIAVSRFDFEDRSQDSLNVAFPSAIASYYITTVPANATYVFSGTFLKGTGVFQSNLMTYNHSGDLAPSAESRHTNSTTGEVTVTVNNTNSKFMWVLQRYYLCPDIYDHTQMVANLFNVSRITENFGTLEVPKMSELFRDMLSRILTIPIRKLVTQTDTFNVSMTPIPFMLPGSTKSLFADKSHVYLFSNPAGEQVGHIAGSFVPNTTLVYMDFIVVNQNTTATESGLPFYKYVESDGTYNISVAAKDYGGEVNANCIRWHRANEYPLVLARYITYDYDKVDFSGPKSPTKTAAIFGSMYPEVTYGSSDDEGSSCTSGL